MTTARPFAYNPPPNPTIPGTDQVGSLAVGTPSAGFTLSPRFWNGPDENLGYVIAHPVPAGNQPTPIFGVSAYLGFNRTPDFTDASFISLAEYVSSVYAGNPQTFATATGASQWLTTNGYWNSYGLGFTLTSLDFTLGQPIYQGTTPVGTNGVDGFVNNTAQTWLYEGYYGTGLSAGKVAEISAIYTNLGLSLSSNQGYVWNVTWGSGSTISTGLVKFGFYGPGQYFDIQTIDPTDTNYLQQNTNNGTVLTGTFLFPATFTPYLPLIDKNGWC